jgi:kynurenine formamidase
LSSCARAPPNNISRGEHTGTHFDAPACWGTGKHVAGTTDTILAGRFIAPACVIDCTREVAANESFILEPAQIEAFEARPGPSDVQRTPCVSSACRHMRVAGDRLRSMMNLYKFSPARK